MKQFQLNHSLSFKLYQSIKHIAGTWDAIPSPSILLSSVYLDTLETWRPENMAFRYVIVYQSKQPVAAFYFQLLPFNAADRLQLKDVPKDSLLSCFYRHIKKLVASKMDFVTLICGNLLATGAYGFKYDPSINYEKLQEIFDEVLRTLFDHVDLIDHASVCLVKELPVSMKFDDTKKSNLKYFHPFYIQPSMLMQIQSSWTNVSDYLHALQSKYRLRLRKALDAAKDLRHAEFGIDEIKIYRDEIYNLYFNTADGSDFNLVNLHTNYFLHVKEKLGNKYRVFGFFKEDELIAFYSYFDDGHELLGHFLGTMKANNLKYQVYLNILLKFIEHGISNKYKQINLARTAIEIKSTVGAYPVEMLCYLTHRKRIYNSFVPKLIRLLKPSESYIIRHPFKKVKTKD